MQFVKLFLLLLVASSFIFPKLLSTEQVEDTTLAIPDLSLKDATRIPEGVNNWRSPQLTDDSLSALLQREDIHTVIRLNGDGKDAGALDIAKEMRICLDHEVTFVTITLSKVGEEAAAKLCAQYLDAGNTLIHCRHGYDRTGAMVGYWLGRNGFTPQQIVQANAWESYLERKGAAYKKYYDLALGIDQPEKQ